MKVKRKDWLTAYQYIDGMNFSTFYLAMSEKQSITLPMKLAYPDNAVPINTKKMSDIKKSVAYVLETAENNDFWIDIFHWKTVE